MLRGRYKDEEDADLAMGHSVRPCSKLAALSPRARTPDLSVDRRACGVEHARLSTRSRRARYRPFTIGGTVVAANVNSAANQTPATTVAVDPAAVAADPAAVAVDPGLTAVAPGAAPHAPTQTQPPAAAPAPAANPTPTPAPAPVTATRGS